jgi:enolase-phosphatase E1
VSAIPAAAGIQAILLDIEGTTTPITFVYDVLFPYARTRLRQHIEQHAAEPEYQLLFDRLRDDHAGHLQDGEDVPTWTDAPPPARLGSVVSHVERLMDRDSKSTALKALQGRIWEEGYARGELVSDMFPDVPPALARWRAQGRRIGVFSSGSVLAQQLLFRHSTAGDLTGLLQWYFDQTIGAKTAAASYSRIAAVTGIAPDRLLFVSDVTGELDAARAAGLRTILSERPGNKPVPSRHGHRVIRTFDEL